LTVTGQNIHELFSDEFIDFLVEKGVVYIWSFHYIPVGRNPNVNLMITPEQRLWLVERVRELIHTRSLSPEQAIGKPAHRDYPLLKGKEFLTEALFNGVAGQAYSSSGGDYKGNLAEILELPLQNDRERTIFIASLNATLRYLTHKYGYGLVVNPVKISTATDLQKEGVRLGCPREGSASDVALHRLIDKYNLDKAKIISNTLRLSPAKQVLSLLQEELDAAMLPEHYASMAESWGYRMLLSGSEIWPDMQGSVVVVKTELIVDNPSMVRDLVRVSKAATNWVNEHPYEAATIMLHYLEITNEDLSPRNSSVLEKLKLSPQTLQNSLKNLEYRVEIDMAEVQEAIDYLESLGYIPESFSAEKILDLTFLEE